MAQERNAYLTEQSRELDAFLKPRYPMARILRQSQVTIHNLSIDDSIDGASFPVDVTALLSDQEFANHIAFAEDASLLVVQSIDELVDQARRILSIIGK